MGALCVVVALAGGCSSGKEDKQAGPKAAIAAVAAQLDVPLVGAPPEAYQKLMLPERYDRTDLVGFIDAYKVVFGQNWMGALQRQKLHVGWPGDLRLLTEDTSKDGWPPTGATQCPELNGNNATVGPAAPHIFYCAKDSMSVPGLVQYPQGTLWAPIEALGARAMAADLLGEEFGTPPKQVTQVLVVELTAAWSDALTRQIRAHAQEDLGISLPVFEQREGTRTFGYCVAGLLARSAFGPVSAAPRAVGMVYGQETESPFKEYAAALRQGYETNTLRACVQRYWPPTSS